jgi:hypothetical protein
VPQAPSNVEHANVKPAKKIRYPRCRGFDRLHSMATANTTDEPPSDNGLQGAGRLPPTGVEDNVSIDGELLPLVRGLGLNAQLTPVGRVAGAQVNRSDSPVMPVPAATETGIFTDPPEGSVVVVGTTSMGCENTLTCVVALVEELPFAVAVMVTFPEAGGGVGAVKSPFASIVPAEAVQVTGWFAVN